MVAELVTTGGLASGYGWMDDFFFLVSVGIGIGIGVGLGRPGGS